MNCLQNFRRSSVCPLQSFNCHHMRLSSNPNTLGMMNRVDSHRNMAIKATSGSTSNAHISGANEKEEKSDTYSHNMTEAMGAVLTYRHELGMNYNFIRPDLIVGSCLQSPADVDKLRSIGVKTIFCLQQNSDLEYFGVDIAAIREHANSSDDIEHIRAEISWHTCSGFKAINLLMLSNCFCRCLFMQSKRSCFPKLDAIKTASADILTGLRKKPINLSWGNNNCSMVEISGLDIGWGQRVPLTYDKEQGLWILKRELPEGHYEYKYIIDGEWTCNKYELVTSPNKDGQVNNCVQAKTTPNSIHTNYPESRSDSTGQSTAKKEFVTRYE